MMFRQSTLAFIVTLLTASPMYALETVNISVQPAYHAIPIYAEMQYGWFEELGLKINLSIVSSLQIPIVRMSLLFCKTH